MPGDINNRVDAAAYLERQRQALFQAMRNGNPRPNNPHHGEDARVQPQNAHQFVDALFNPALLANQEMRPQPAPGAAIVRGIREQEALWERINAPPVPLPEFPPLPDGVETHRLGADQATRKAVGLITRRHPLTRDAAGALANEVLTFVNTHFHADERDAATRTLNGEHRSDEDFTSIADTESTYLLRVGGRDQQVPTLVAAMAFWKAIDELPEAQRPEARLQFGAALVQGQQDGSHICAPGQVQIIASHMQWYFAALYRIAPPPPEPEYVAARLTDFIEQHAINHVVPSAKHALVREAADRALRNFVATDRQLTRDGFLRSHRRDERAVSVQKLLHDNVEGVYGITWALPNLENLPSA